MSLSAPRIIFGVHSLTPYSRANRMPFGILKVIGSASLGLSSSTEELFGGAQRFSWAAETKTISAEMSAKVMAYPGFLFTQFLGASSTDNAGESTGSVGSITNVKGSSVMSATTGVASIALTTAKNGDVKFGNFLLIATDATHVDVYAYSDVDFPRGADPAAYVNDALKVTTAPLTIPSGTTVDIPNLGLTLTGGSGSIALVTGDVAWFKSRPENSTSSDIVVGNAATAFSAFGAMILAQKRVTAEMCEIDAFNCVASGFPMPMTSFAYSETEVKVKMIYDSAQDGVFKIRTVAPLTFT